MFEAVSYHLPKSRSFHQAAKGKPRAAWEKIEQMLATMGNDVQLSANISLSVDPASAWVDADVASACLDDARRLFGPERDPSQVGKSWDLAPEHLPAAMEFAFSDVRWPRQKIGPISLRFAYHFNWRDFPGALPATILDWNRGTCFVMVTFSRGACSVAPSLVFPVPYEDAAFHAFIERLGPMLPFEIKPQYFRRMLVNPKSGATRHLRLA